ncbi:MAG TPA: PH domain-containing protein [Isosphaeraceae bacterium]|jgi:hypothetical protein
MANDSTTGPEGLSEQITTADPVVVESPPPVQELFPQPPAKPETPAQPEMQKPDPVSAASDEKAAAAESRTTPNPGVGIEGEFSVWEGRYSMKNFFGRFVFRTLLTIAWIVLAVRAWAWGDASTTTTPVQGITIFLGIVLVLYWLYLGWQVLGARFGHYYRLTNRRLFVSTGIFNRRRDQVELLSVKDVFTRQPSLFHRWFSVGTVVIESSEQKLPVTYLTGVDDPKAVMDKVWHCARAEREGKAVQIDNV